MNAGSVVMTMMKKMRNSVPWNQMMAIDHPGQRRDALQEHQERGDIALELRLAADRDRQQRCPEEGAERGR